MIICFFPKFPTFQVMQQFFSSRVCCDFCERFGREMSLNDAKVNSSSDVKSSVKHWDYFGPRWIKNPLHGMTFPLSASWRPARIHVRRRKWLPGEVVRVFTSVDHPSFYDLLLIFVILALFVLVGLEFWVLVSWQSWHWWRLFWFGIDLCRKHSR